MGGGVRKGSPRDGDEQGNLRFFKGTSTMLKGRIKLALKVMVRLGGRSC